MNQKTATVFIVAVLVIVLIAGWALQKNNGDTTEQAFDTSLVLSDDALDSFSLPERTAQSDALWDNVIPPSSSVIPPKDGIQPLSSIIPESMDKKKEITATLHTEKGDIVIALHSEKTPKTVENFVVLAKKDFYTNTIFHRTIKGFMIQGGDPKGDGTGGPGYTFDDEPFEGEYTRGTVAMANAGPNTNGSQFFIMHTDYPLPKNYVIFGTVIRGMDVVDTIATAPTTFSSSGENSKPVTPVKVKSVEISE